MAGAEASDVARRLELLARAMRAVTEAPDPVAALARIAAIAVPTLGDGCAIDVLHTLGAPWRAATFPEHAAASDGAAACVAQAILQGRAVVVDGALAVPLVVRGAVLGALSVIAPRGPEGEALADAEELARCAALAADRARPWTAAGGSLLSDQESMALLDTFFTTAPVGLGYWDRELRFRRVNAKLAEINGHAVSDHIGRSLGEILPELKDTLEPLFRGVLETGQPVVELDVSGETPAQPGRQRHWLASYYPVRALGGAIIGVGAIVVEITERKEQEAALRLAEERLRTVVANTPIVLFALDLEGRYTVLEGKPLEALGLDRTQIIGRSAFEVFSDCPWILEGARHGVAGDACKVSGELRGRWFESSMQPYHDAQGRLIGSTGAATDLTERKRAEDALRATRDTLERKVRERTEALSRANEELHREIADRQRAEEALREREHQLAQAQQIARIGSWTWDIARDEAIWSEELCRIYGVKPGLVRSALDYMLSLIHPADRAHVEAEIRRSLHPVGSFDVEFCLVRPEDGRVRTIHALGRMIESADGVPLRMVGTGQDVTEQKGAEQAQARLAAIIKHSEDAIVSETLDGIIQTWNAGAERLFGYSADEAIGMEIARLIPPDRMGEQHDSIARVLRGEAVVNLDTERVCRDGHRVEVSVTLSPTLDAAGRITGLAAISRDIRESKATERALRASLREKDVLLKEVHHRVKNNLQVISSLLNLQAQRVPDAVSREVLRESQSRVRSIALVHERIYQSTDLYSIDLDAYLRALVHSLIAMYDTRARRVTIEVLAEGIRLGIDTAMHCGLIVNELVSNALKHAFPEHGGCIRVALDREGDALLLRVTDDGIGFPRGIEVRNATSLGLQLVSSLTAQIGGTLSMTSGPGTTFTVRFAG